MTVRIAYTLFTPRGQKDKEGFAAWAAANRMYRGEEPSRLNGAGEMLVSSAADFENFRVVRPDMPANMEADLEGVVGLRARNTWAFRLHATHDETTGRALDVFQRVNRDASMDTGGGAWFSREEDRKGPFGAGAACRPVRAERRLFRGRAGAGPRD